MRISRTVGFGLGLTVIAFAVAAILYDRLPASMPVHWGIHGTVDGYMTKPWGVFFYPGLIAAMVALTIVLPALSPRGFRIEPFARVFDIFMTVLTLFFAYIMAVVFAAVLGLAVPLNQAVLGGIGVLFIVLGNFLGKVTKNFYVGIRTPWTLVNDEVWLRTHRFGGWLLVIAGLSLVVAAVLGRGFTVSIAVFAAALIAPIIYSYVLYRRLSPPSV